MRLLAILAALSLAATLPAQELDRRVTSACAAELRTPLPPDIASAPTPKTLPGCSSYRLYDKGDWRQARACAISERTGLLARLPGGATESDSASQSLDTPSLGGSVILALLYANGEGVPRNPAVAARLWCEGAQQGEIEVPPGDDENVQKFLATLASIKSGKLGAFSGSARLALCDAYGSSPDRIPDTRACERLADEIHAEQHYGGIQEAYEDAEKRYEDGKAAVARLIPTLTPTQQAAYHRLSAAFDHFMAVNITGGDLNSPPYAPSQGFGPPSDFARQCMYGEFYKAVVDGAHGEVLRGVGETLDEADAKLNSNWRDLLSLESLPAGGGAQLIAQLRTEERAWMAYRDAFIAFGTSVRGPAERDKWAEAVTGLREGDLNTTVENEKIESKEDR